MLRRTASGHSRTHALSTRTDTACGHECATRAVPETWHARGVPRSAHEKKPRHHLRTGTTPDRTPRLIARSPLPFSGAHDREPQQVFGTGSGCTRRGICYTIDVATSHTKESVYGRGGDRSPHGSNSKNKNATTVRGYVQLYWKNRVAASRTEE